MPLKLWLPCFRSSITWFLKNRDRVVGIATMILVGQLMIRGSVADRCSRILCSVLYPVWFRGAPSLLTSGYRRPFPCSKKSPGRETDHTSPSRIKVKMRGSIFPQKRNRNRNKQKTPCPESVSKLYPPSDSRLSTKIVPTIADRRVPRSQSGRSPTTVISIF
jgi:hypothetical protein